MGYTYVETSMSLPLGHKECGGEPGLPPRTGALMLAASPPRGGAGDTPTGRRTVCTAAGGQLPPPAGHTQAPRRHARHLRRENVITLSRQEMGPRQPEVGGPLLSCHSTHPRPLSPPCAPWGPSGLHWKQKAHPLIHYFSARPWKRGAGQEGTEEGRRGFVRGFCLGRRTANPGSEKVGWAREAPRRRRGRNGSARAPSASRTRTRAMIVSQGAVHPEPGGSPGSPVRSAETTFAPVPLGLSFLLKVSRLLLQILTSHVHPHRSEAQSNHGSLPSAFS